MEFTRWILLFLVTSNKTFVHAAVSDVFSVPLPDKTYCLGICPLFKIFKQICSTWISGRFLSVREVTFWNLIIHEFIVFVEGVLRKWQCCRTLLCVIRTKFRETVRSKAHMNTPKFHDNPTNLPTLRNMPVKPGNR